MTATQPDDEARLLSAVAADPLSVDAKASLASFLQKRKRYIDAATVLRDALTLDPQRTDLRADLGHVLWAAGDAMGAITAYAAALAARPADAQCAMNLAHALAAQGDRDQALRWMRHALSTNPLDPVLQMNLGVIHFHRGEIAEAATHYARAIELRPAYPEAWLNYGNAALYAGDAKVAIERFDRALRLKPELEKALSNIILGLSYVPGAEPRDILSRAVEWNSRFARPRSTRADDQARRQPDRPLRIGYVSPDLGNHPIGHFMAGVFQHHDTDAYGFTVYAERAIDDAMTRQLQARAFAWHRTVGVSDDDLMAQIRADRIDILIDLAGHTSGSRLRVFSAKPAPVQVTWIGSIGTTGCAAMDYLIADRRHVPEGTEANFVEVPLMLEQWISYTPPGYMPRVSVLPANRNGFVTFGCFANPAKINSDLISAWSAILQAVPASRLLLKYRWMDSRVNRERIYSVFTSSGIDTNRLQIEGETPHADLLARYGDIDIALDTFPYSGGVTTAEALWMGVPVITRPEARFASRHSLSILSAADLTEYVAETTRDYIALAIRVAADTEALAARRASLRDRMVASRLGDSRAFTRNLEAGLRQVWRRYCVRTPD